MNEESVMNKRIKLPAVSVAKNLLECKHVLRKGIFEVFKISIDDTEIISHYYQTQENLDKEITEYMGWKWQEPDELKEVINHECN